MKHVAGQSMHAPSPGRTGGRWPGCVALFVAMLAACGGKQDKSDDVEPIAEEAPNCISDRWAQPPEQIGETPPEEFPSVDAIQPFRSSQGAPGSVDVSGPAAPSSDRDGAGGDSSGEAASSSAPGESSADGDEDSDNEGTPAFDPTPPPTGDSTP